MPAIDFKKEHQREYLFRDTRTAEEKFADLMRKQGFLLSLALGTLAISIVFSAYADVMALFALFFGFIGIGMMNREGLPMYMPKSSKLIDPKEQHPATGKALPAQGIIYAGTDMATKQEVWLSDTQARTHMLFMGTTGSGKAQPDDTLVLTPKGWVYLCALQPGDWVCIPGGSQAKVLSIHPQGFRTQNKIVVKERDGIVLKTHCCDEHLWDVKVVKSGETVDDVQNQTMTCAQMVQAIKEGAKCFLPTVDVKEAQADTTGHATSLVDWNDKSTVSEDFQTVLGAGKPRWSEVTQIRKAKAKSSRCIKIDSLESLYIVKGSDTFFKDEEGHMVQKAITTHNTEFLLSIVYNSLIHCSGFIYVDGKGDAKTYRSIYSLLRATGRDDDALIINFQTGAKDIIGAQASKMSNTLNICATGSSGMLSQAFMGLMATGKSDIWSERANSLIEGLVKPLVFLRDQYKMPLDVSVVREHFLLDWIEAMVLCYPSSFPGIEETLSGLKAYLDNLPGWNKENAIARKWTLSTYKEKAKEEFVKKYNRAPMDKKPEDVQAINEICMSLFDFYEFKKQYESGLVDSEGNAIEGQDQDTMLQHGYITMQLVRSFNSLSDTYGYIMKTAQAEVDLTDVFLNRRILMVLLPALEKAPAELSNLGKIIVSALKATMAIGLGSQIEGETIRIIDSRPTNSNSPFLCVLDEYGYYAVEGFAVVPAQARSLGFSAIFAGQDLPAFEKASKEEAKSTLANANSKFCGKLECTDTYEYFRKLAGEGSFSTVRSFDNEGVGAMGNNKFYDSRSISIEKYARVSQEDLRGHGSGKWHFFFGNTIVHLNSFFANPRPVSLLRTNHFIKVVRPEEDEQRIYKHATDKFQSVLGKAHGNNTVSKSISKGELPVSGLRNLLKDSESNIQQYNSEGVFSHLQSMLEAYQAISLKPLADNEEALQVLLPAKQTEKTTTSVTEGGLLKRNAQLWEEFMDGINFKQSNAHKLIHKGDGVAQALATVGCMLAQRDMHQAKMDKTKTTISQKEEWTASFKAFESRKVAVKDVLKLVDSNTPSDIPEDEAFELFHMFDKAYQLIEMDIDQKIEFHDRERFERKLERMIKGIENYVADLPEEKWEEYQQINSFKNVLSILRSSRRMGYKWLTNQKQSQPHQIKHLLVNQQFTREQIDLTQKAVQNLNTDSDMQRIAQEAEELTARIQDNPSSTDSVATAIRDLNQGAIREITEGGEEEANLAVLSSMSKQTLLDYDEFPAPPSEKSILTEKETVQAMDSMSKGLEDLINDFVIEQSANSDDEYANI